MSIGIISYDYYPHIGGQGVALTNLLRQLRERVSSTPFHLFSPGEARHEHDHSVCTWTRSLPHGHIAFSLMVPFLVREWESRYQIDAWIIPAGPGGLVVRPPVKRPYIAITYHSYVQQTRHVHSDYWKKLFIPWERALYEHARHLVTSSHDAYSTLCTYYQQPKEKITLLPLALEVPKHIGEIRRKEYSLLYVGRLDSRKRVHLLLEMLPNIISQYPKVTLDIVGKGVELESLKKRARELLIDSHVHFHGFVPDNELPKLYSQATAFITPSSLEGFGLTALESLHYGTPVICGDVPGLRDFVTDHVNGLLLPPDTLSAWSEAICTLFGDRELQRRLQAEALASSHTIANWGNTLNAYTKIFKDLDITLTTIE